MRQYHNGERGESKIKLKVVDTNPKFVGRGMALIDLKVTEELVLMKQGEELCQ
jgi:hypothetical protein